MFTGTLIMAVNNKSNSYCYRDTHLWCGGWSESRSKFLLLQELSL